MTEVIKHSYQTNPQNTNCEQGHLVSDIKECMNASRELKREYIGRTTSMNRPVGCYWSSYDRAYFNTITDPLSTRPKHFGNRGGICTKPRMSNVTVVLIFVPCIFCSFTSHNTLYIFIIFKVDSTMESTTSTTTILKNASVKIASVATSNAQTSVATTKKNLVTTGLKVSTGTFEFP